MKNVVIVSFSFEQEQEGFRILQAGGLNPILLAEKDRIGYTEKDFIQYWELLEERPTGLLIGADIMLGQAFAEKAAGLQAVSLNCAGMDHLDLLAFEKAGIRVQNVPRQNFHAVADFIWGQILSLMRKIPKGNEAIRHGLWCEGVQRGMAVSGKKIGIIGFGAIGQAVAKRAAGFDMEILVSSTSKSKELAEQYGVTYVDRETLFAQSDILVPTCPLTEDTYHLINQEVLRQMKREAVIINAARGGIIHTEALIEAVREGRIAGAALDVFEEEPLMDSELFAMEELLLTPHMGGLADREIRNVALQAAGNMVEMLKEERKENE